MPISKKYGIMEKVSPNKIVGLNNFFFATDSPCKQNCSVLRTPLPPPGRQVLHIGMNQNDFWSIRDANIKNLIVIPFQRRLRGRGQSRLIYLNLCRFTYVPIIREHRLSSNEKITQYIGWTPYVCISPSKWTIVKWRGIVLHSVRIFGTLFIIIFALAKTWSHQREV